MKKIKIHIKDKESSWMENYNIEDEEDPIQYALDIINNHNRGLYPFELVRKLVYVEVIKEKRKLI